MVWPLVVAAVSAGALAYDYIKEKTTSQPQVVIHEATVSTQQDSNNSDAARTKKLIIYHVAGAVALGYIYIKLFKKRRL